MTRVAAILLAAALAGGCQAGVWKEAGDAGAKGGIVFASAGGGALLGGPLGAAVGGLLGFLGVDVAETKTAFAAAQRAWEAREVEHAAEVAQAQATGQRQGSAQAGELISSLRGDAEAMEFFQGIADGATRGLEAEVESLEAELRRRATAILRTVAGWTLAGLAAVVAVLVFVLKRSEKKQEQRFLTREEVKPYEAAQAAVRDTRPPGGAQEAKKPAGP